MEWWSIGVLEYWSIGVMEYWSTGVLIEAHKWKSQPYRQARAERSAIESLVFTYYSSKVS